MNCLPTETSNKAQAGIFRPLSRDISQHGESEDRRDFQLLDWARVWTMSGLPTPSLDERFLASETSLTRVRDIALHRWRTLISESRSITSHMVAIVDRPHALHCATMFALTTPPITTPSNEPAHVIR
jgi:hypothetical protein